MIERQLLPRIREALGYSPAVALLGPRQCGKTTLAWALNPQQPALYLDLESEQDRAKLAEPELYLAAHQDKLVILDEIHRAPGLFPVLRGLIGGFCRVNVASMPCGVSFPGCTSPGRN